jgi:alpha-L-fucosidase
MTTDADRRIWADLARPLPGWLGAAKLGIFIHWGRTRCRRGRSLPGALGAVPEAEWFRHNPYAEWYANTIRISGHPRCAAQSRGLFGCALRRFLDQWTASDFDPAAWARLFVEAGAS